MILSKSNLCFNPFHPHAKGLVAAYRKQSTGHKVVDYSRHGNDMDIVGATWEANGLHCNTNGEYAVFDNTNQIINSEQGTIVLKFKSDSAMNDGVSHSLLGSWLVGGAVLGSFSIYKSAGTSLLYFNLGDDITRHYIQLDSTLLPNWQTGQQIGMLWNYNSAIYDSKNIAANIDGVHKTPHSSSSATGWNTYTVSPNIYVGNDAEDTNKEMNGVIEYLNVYNTVLSENMLKSIRKDPDGMFKSSTDKYLKLIR